MDDFLKHIQFNKEALDAEPLPIINWNEEKHALLEMDNKDEVKAFIQSNRNLLDTELPPLLFTNELPIARKTNKSYFAILRFAAAACIIAVALFGAFNWFSPVPKVINNDIVKIPNQQKTQEQKVTNNLSKDEIIKNNNFATITPKPNGLKSDAVDPFLINTIPKNEQAKAKPKQLNSINSYVQTNPNSNASLASFHLISDGYNGIINSQLDKIQHTPIYTNDKDMFAIFKQQFKQLDFDETQLKKNIKKFGFNDTYLQEYINISQYKLKVLQQLQTEIQKINLQKKQAGNIVDSLNINYITL